MKIEMEIPDLEEIYCSRYGEEEINGNDLKEIIADIVIDKFVEEMYESYIKSLAANSLHSRTVDLFNQNKDEIINRAVDKVATEVLKKKAIVSEMPKKSEIEGINKEWEKYFMELIDKAIAKKFK